ncbi:5'/3'-nucleotidase SurE [Desulfonema ishimotonii]|uniref:5'-nucleotidase SurE n=1 Tax=Desulfonema ishimotonii TaxID=45657 RepID=A0A401FQU2_9BACT|nr:5'/3'-nucleotidase SurE [Desulfonema ishimotonii]GBC59336.1 5'/3'-nucleotidase SurE [Desulfonema ishimotonii]
MKILLTNDDGIYAPGLWALYDRLSGDHTVTVVAPDRERSAVSHGITLNDPLRAFTVSLNGYRGHAVSGKPADCVRLGLQELMTAPPDMVISGINPGANVGVNINYSGTVAAAREAVLFGIPAIAVSVQGHDVRHYAGAARFAEKVTQGVSKKGLPFGTLLNINLPDLPPDQIRGVRISRQGISKISDGNYERRTDPRNRPYHWLGVEKENRSEAPDVDGGALSRNFISVTPIRCDMTDYGLLEELRNWNFE